jgi:hypothetical protein
MSKTKTSRDLMKIFFWTTLMLVFSQAYASELMHRPLLEYEKKNNTFVWEEIQLSPFDELIVSWDAERPLNGSYLIQVSLFTSEWSPWLDYAFWGTYDQYTFKKELPDLGIQVYQDAVEVLQDNKASGFRIRIIANEKVSLDGLRTLHISAIDRSTHNVNFTPSESVSVDLKVIGLSQIALSDERHLRLCSPTSTTAVINFLSGTLTLSPIEFANSVVDSTFDIYGNWILNTAQASHVLGKSWHCFVARLTSFNQIIDQLMKGYPVVVSIRGPLKGSALPYESGHLVVVTGYDSKNQEVFCMDPAFPTDDLTHIKYPLNEFLAAWSRRQGIAYLFNQ